MLLVIGHLLGLLRLPGMLQYLNYRLGERNERFLQALLGVPPHLLLDFAAGFAGACRWRHAGKDSGMVAVSASILLFAVCRARRAPGHGIVLMCCLS